MDNGTEMTAHALKDWCRFSKTGTAYIDPGSPWQNPFVESFHSRVRYELLDVEEFACVAEARRDRRLARGLQPPQAAQLARDAHPSRVRRRVAFAGVEAPWPCQTRRFGGLRITEGCVSRG